MAAGDSAPKEMCVLALGKSDTVLLYGYMHRICSSRKLSGAFPSQMLDVQYNANLSLVYMQAFTMVNMSLLHCIMYAYLFYGSSLELTRSIRRYLHH